MTTPAVGPRVGPHPPIKSAQPTEPSPMTAHAASQGTQTAGRGRIVQPVGAVTRDHGPRRLCNVQGPDCVQGGRV
jgi:hypothetical protein